MNNNTFILIIIFFCSGIFFGCDDDKKELIGSWQSISIENPSLLFSKTLPNKKIGSITFIINNDETFRWIDEKGPKVNGLLTIKRTKMSFAPENNTETVQVAYTIKDNRLILKTDDNFAFTFERVTAVKSSGEEKSE